MSTSIWKFTVIVLIAGVLIFAALNFTACNSDNEVDPNRVYLENIKDLSLFFGSQYYYPQNINPEKIYATSSNGLYEPSVKDEIPRYNFVGRYESRLTAASITGKTDNNIAVTFSIFKDGATHYWNPVRYRFYNLDFDRIKAEYGAALDSEFAAAVGEMLFDGVRYSVRASIPNKESKAGCEKYLDAVKSVFESLERYA